MVWAARQCRKPTGVLGRRVARVMNVTQSGLTDWGLSHVTIGQADHILDIGCGGGRTIQKLATIASDGHVTGLDYSSASVEVAGQINADSIAAGRVTVTQGSVAVLPFADGTFDLVTAIETHYYWPELDRGMLRRGGERGMLSQLS